MSGFPVGTFFRKVRLTRRYVSVEFELLVRVSNKDCPFGGPVGSLTYGYEVLTVRILELGSFGLTFNGMGDTHECTGIRLFVVPLV